MNLSAKAKKRIVWALLLPFICLLFGGAVLYFLVVHRFKEGVQYIVKKETKGRYAFNASEADVSLWDGSIRLKKAILYNSDTTNADWYYTVHIAEIYFSLSSWQELLFHKKIIVDSLSIIEPFFDIHVHKLPTRKTSPDFHASDILNYLENALAHFNVHSFSLKDAAFSYRQEKNTPPLQGDHINFSVSNFTKIDDNDSHLLGSDMVSISLGPQHWRLPGGKIQMDFNRLSFDSKDQRFQIDSFSFYQQAATGNGNIRIQGNKFFFNSRHLPAIYQKEQLLLDSLICIDPVLSIPGYATDNSSPDSVKKSSAKNNLFNFVNVKFIAVINGELLLEDKKGRTGKATTRKANLNIYNLSVHPAIDPYPSTDSIRINLKNIGFLTKDSLYRLTIDEFSLHRDDAIFSQVKFGPLRPDATGKKVEFTAPALVLKKIDIVALMQQRLTASAAELRQPLIVMYDRHNPTDPANSAARRSTARKLALFYRTLHHISELINTRDFNIIDGAANYYNTGRSPLEAKVLHLDAHILLNKFFISDSLADIKHAIPDVRIGKIDLISDKITASAHNLWFNGVSQQSRIKEVNATTTTGLKIKGENIFWNAFDWDGYQKDRSIRLNDLSVGRLTADRIAANNTLHFIINDWHATGLVAIRQLFTWTSLNMNLSDIQFKNQKSATTIREGSFNSDSGLLLKDLEFRSGNNTNTVRVSAPLIRLNTYLHSTDFSRLEIPSFLADKVTMHYATRASDTLIGEATGKIEIKSCQLVPKKEVSIRYETATLHLQNTSIRKNNARLNLSNASLLLSDGRVDSRNGQKPSLDAQLLFSWKDAGLYYAKDSTTLSLDGLSGNFKEKAFHWSPETKLDWQQLLAASAISKGKVHYQNKKITADLAACSWDPDSRSLQLNDFSVLPNENLETTFGRSKWQRDYIQLKGHRLIAAGISFSPIHQPLAVHMNKLTVESMQLSASRDKRMPFQHGIEKLMPTRLVSTMPLSVNIDTVSIRSSTVTYNECSLSTGRWSSIPIEDINGTILHLGNSHYQKDTLMLSATGRLFDGHIRHFLYRESYADSLSAFTASTWFSAIDLTKFSQVSIPAAAVSITGGHADTAWSSWQGNKYATFGTMNFWYNRLHIKVLNKTDSTKRGFLPTMETWLANLILPTQRKKSSAIFVQRDREKFVFNYWVKAQTSGLLSTLGIKSSRSYLRQYRRLTPSSFTQTSNSSPD